MSVEGKTFVRHQESAQTLDRIPFPGFVSAIVHDRVFLAAVAIGGIMLFSIAELAWPLGGGRAWWEYYASYGAEGTLIRAFGAAYFVGWLAQLSAVGITAVLLSMYLLYLISVYYTALLLGIVAARIVTVLALLEFQNAIMFNTLGLEPLLCLSLSVWTALLVRWYRSPRAVVAFLLGFCTSLLLFVRGTNIPYVLLVGYPVVCFGWNRKTILRSVLFAIAFFLGIGLLATYNLYRHGEFAISQSGSFIVPGLHVYNDTPGFSEDYGPKNRELIRLIRTKLLPQEVYVYNQVDLDIFLTSRDIRKFSDLIYLDIMFHPGLLFEAAMESIEANKLAFIKSVYNMIWRVFTYNQPHALTLPEQKRPAHSSDPAQGNVDAHLAVVPPNPQSIPIGYSSVNEELNRIQAKVITELTPRLSPEERMQYQKKIEQIKSMLDKPGNYHISLIAKSVLLEIIPPMTVFLLLSFLLLFSLKREEARVLTLLLIPTFLIVVGSGIVHPLPYYR
ncbi:MAG: hypothetical protein HQL75_13975, partial [Magnetococcales bacterium]|nr:hypothetical protein [Magnetococcales bacterium]